MSEPLDLAAIRARGEGRRHLPEPIQRISVDGAACDIFDLCDEVERLRSLERQQRDIKLAACDEVERLRAIGVESDASYAKIRESFHRNADTIAAMRPVVEAAVARQKHLSTDHGEKWCEEDWAAEWQAELDRLSIAEYEAVAAYRAAIEGEKP
jgi:hypothetical protein